MSLSSEYEDIRGTIRFSFMKWILLLHVSKRVITSSVKTYFACLYRRLGMQHQRLTSCHVSMREWIRLSLMQIGLPLLQRLRPQRLSKTRCPILFKYRKCMVVGRHCYFTNNGSYIMEHQLCETNKAMYVIQQGYLCIAKQCQVFANKSCIAKQLQASLKTLPTNEW